MSVIDFPLLAEMLLAFVVVATLDSPGEPEAPVEEATPEEPLVPGWSPECDLHAQRILRLESLRGERGISR
jgi:hypothetical protein